MAMPAVKFDDGTGGFASNCFPVRGLVQQDVDGSGAWLTAHKAEQRRRFKAVLCTKPRTFDSIREERKRAVKTGTSIVPPPTYEDDLEDKTLDGFFLMKHCCVEDPSDLCSVNVSGQQLSEVKEEDFVLFDNVAYVNAAENILPMEAFRHFPIIRELEVPLNGVRNVKINMGDFPTLEMLDLSYNNLSQDDLLTLGMLPQLKVLHLTGNSLKTLPQEMARPHTAPNRKRYARYSRLEILILDDNRLSDLNVFAAVAGMKRLRHLSLMKNEVYSVPQLMVMDGRHVTDLTSAKKSRRSGRKSHRSTKTQSRKSGRSSRTIPKSTDLPKASELNLPDPPPMFGLEGAGSIAGEQQAMENTEPSIAEQSVEETIEPVEIKSDPHLTEASESQEKLDGVDSMLFEDLKLDEMDFEADDLSAKIEAAVRSAEELEQSEHNLGEDPVDRLSDVNDTVLPPPFPELRYLNLAYNKISDEEGLLAVAAWPMLSEIVIHDNPLTTENSGDPPLLKRYLTERLGITIVRKRPGVLQKPAIEIQAKPERRVETQVQKVPKRNVEEIILAIEAPFKPPPLENHPMLMPSPKPPQSPAKERPLSSKAPLPPITPVEEQPRMTPDVPAKQRTPPAEDSGAFFMTQVDGPGEEDANVVPKPPPQEKRKQRKKKPVTPAKKTGYDILYDEDEDVEDVPAPKDIQGNVRALQYMLSHPLVFRENEVHLDKPQRPFIPYAKSVSYGTSAKGSSQLSIKKPTPRGPTRKTKQERVDEALDVMRDRKTLVEDNLDSVLKLKPKKVSADFADAPRLLGQLNDLYAISSSDSD